MTLPPDNDINSRLLAAAMKRLDAITRSMAFDPIKPDSKPTPSQQQVLDDFGNIPTQIIVAGNQSGKSQTCSRITTWFAEENHPTWKRPAEWGNEPLLILVAGRTGKQIEESLLPKLRSYLTPGTYREVRVNNSTQRLELDNGNRIIFQSLENPSVARERLQSYVAHLAWIDEQPPTMAIYTELQLRVQARNGYLLASFTPLVESLEITRFVDGLTLPYGKKYMFNMLDNPVYQDPIRKAKILAEYDLLPEAIKNTRLYGAWSASDNAVYYYDPDTMMRELPSTYSTGWRHAVSVDPALKSALGLVLAGEDPNSGKWYCVRAQDISGIYNPIELVQYVEKVLAGYNIVKRIADPHEVWYIETARALGIHYHGVYNKNTRKGELIKGYQAALGSKFFLTPGSVGLGDDMVQCKWSDKAEGKIINSSSWHTLDAAQYLVDGLPKWDGPTIPQGDWHSQLYIANEQRKISQAKKMMKYQLRSRRFR